MPFALRSMMIMTRMKILEGQNSAMEVNRRWRIGIRNQSCDKSAKQQGEQEFGTHPIRTEVLGDMISTQLIPGFKYKGICTYSGGGFFTGVGNITFTTSDFTSTCFLSALFYYSGFIDHETK